MGGYEIGVFLVAFLLGMGLGQVFKWPLRGALLGVGLVLALYYFLDPAGAQDLAKAWLRAGAAWALGALGYPPAWADQLFTPEGGRVVERVAQDLFRHLLQAVDLGRSPGDALEAIGRLGQEVVGRPWLGFVMGVLAGVRG